MPQDNKPSPARALPANPSLEQYKKQAKELVKAFRAADRAALDRVRLHHPRLGKLSDSALPKARIALTDAQLVIAREHGFESWPQFAREIENINFRRETIADPVSEFIIAACVPLDGTSHSSGTLDRAEAILAAHAEVARANIYTAAILADDAAVRKFLADSPRAFTSATAKGGPNGWDPLTYLCFSKYLRIDKSPARSDAFVRAARALLDAGADPNTGWWENNHQPKPEWESVMYGAAGAAHHAAMTRLLLERGADPNDGETPYHAPENYDNSALEVLVESGKLTADSLTTMLVRKADWHDTAGMRYLLQHGADPNRATRWQHNALQHAIRRDNGIDKIYLLLDHGADATLPNGLGVPAVVMAARRGRGDILASLARRGIADGLSGVDALIAACAKNDAAAIASLKTPEVVSELLAQGGALLAEFAGTGNTAGVAHLLDLGVSPAALYDGDPYFELAKNTTALHSAAWHAWPSTVKLLVDRGAPVNALDSRGRTALFLAVRACVNSYWTNRRTPESVAALLAAGAKLDGIEIPCGYDEVDELLRRAAQETASS
jgi:ankyrin repeat protein